MIHFSTICIFFIFLLQSQSVCCLIYSISYIPPSFPLVFLTFLYFFPPSLLPFPAALATDDDDDNDNTEKALHSYKALRQRTRNLSPFLHPLNPSSLPSLPSVHSHLPATTSFSARPPPAHPSPGSLMERHNAHLGACRGEEVQGGLNILAH